MIYEERSGVEAIRARAPPRSAARWQTQDLTLDLSDPGP